MDGHTHNGDIISDYAADDQRRGSKSVSGRIGAGAGKILLNVDVGDVRIKKGSGFPPAPAEPRRLLRQLRARLRT